MRQISENLVLLLSFLCGSPLSAFDCVTVVANLGLGRKKRKGSFKVFVIFDFSGTREKKQWGQNHIVYI
jgi:hypothetical protein